MYPTIPYYVVMFQGIHNIQPFPSSNAQIVARDVSTTYSETPAKIEYSSACSKIDKKHATTNGYFHLRNS